MTEYDSSAGQCRPTTAAPAVHAGHLAAWAMREAAEISSPSVTASLTGPASPRVTWPRRPEQP
jgi:hypothetical protein